MLHTFAHRLLLASALATFLVSGVATQGRAAEAPKPIRALLICGGCCHDYDAQKELISQGLAERARIEVEIEFCMQTCVQIRRRQPRVLAVVAVADVELVLGRRELRLMGISQATTSYP